MPCSPPRPPSDRRRWPPPGFADARPVPPRVRQPPHAPRFPRSSWSRVRLSRIITAGSTARATAARCHSSTSSTAYRASGASVNAATAPSAMFEPDALCATGPPVVRNPAASRWLVVVLPLVPDTSTTRRPAASPVRAPRSSHRVTRPPMIEPAPRPTRRDSRPAQRPVRTANRAHPRRTRLSTARVPGRPRSTSEHTRPEATRRGPFAAPPSQPADGAVAGWTVNPRSDGGPPEAARWALGGNA